MSFLPSGYAKIPTNSDYMKLQEGENTFRVLAPAVVGFLYWNVNNKPVRAKEPFSKMPNDIKPEDDGTYRPNIHFWAFPVWNYGEKRVQLMEVTQATIMTPMKALHDNARWGDPMMYDITITKNGSGLKTEYVVQANPPIAPAEQAILSAYADKPVNLEALFTNGGDPFAPAANLAPAPEQPAAKQPSAGDMAHAELTGKQPASSQLDNPFFTPEERAAEQERMQSENKTNGASAGNGFPL